MATGINAGQVYTTLGIDSANFSQGLTRAQRQINEFSENIRKSLEQSRLDSFFQEMSTIRLGKIEPPQIDTTSLNSGLEKTQSILDGFTKQTALFAAAVGGAFTLAGNEIKAFGAQALAIGGGFESEMTRVATVSGATQSEFDDLTAKARELGATLPITAQQSAQAMGVLASRGYDAAKIIGTIGDITQLAIGQSYNLEATADVLTSTLTNFGLAETEAARIADVFTTANNSSALSMEKLSYAMRYAGPVAKAAGASVEQTAAAMGALADAGYRGENIGVILRSVYNKIASSSQIMGVATHDASGNIRALGDVMADIAKKGGGLAEFTEAFGAKAAAGALTLANSAAKIAELETQLLNSSGATAKNVEKQMQTWDNISLSFASRVESLYITVFEQIKNTSKGTVVSLTDMTQAFEAWVKETNIAGDALTEFMNGLGFSVQSGQSFTDWLKTIDTKPILEGFRGAGEAIQKVGSALASFAKAVPWGTLIGNIDLLSKAAFWSWVSGKGINAATNIGNMASSMAKFASKTFDAGTSMGQLAQASNLVQSSFLAMISSSATLGVMIAAIGAGAYVATKEFAAWATGLNEAEKRLKAINSETRIIEGLAASVQSQQKSADDQIGEVLKKYKDLRAQIGLAAAAGDKVKLDALQAQLPELEKELRKVSDLFHDKTTDTWIIGTAEKIKEANAALHVTISELARVKVEAKEKIEPKFDFSAWSKKLKDESKAIKDSLRDAMSQGVVTPKEALDLQRKNVTALIDKIAAEIKAQHPNGVMSEIWKANALQTLGLDEISLEAQRMSMEINKSKLSLDGLIAYIQKTGNISEFASKQVQEMTDAIIKQQFDSMSAIEKVKIVDALGKIGGASGGEYAKRLAEKLTGGTKDAIGDAITVATTSVDDIEAQVDAAYAKAQQRSKKKRKKDLTSFDVDPIEVKIGEQMVTLTKQETAAFLNGEKEKMAAIKKHYDYMAQLQAQNAQREAELEAKNKPFGEDSKKELSVFQQAITDAGLAGTQAQTAFKASLDAAMASNPIKMPAPVFDTSTLDMSGLMSGLQASVKASMPNVTATITESLAKLSTELYTTGERFGRLLSDGMSKGFQLENLVNKVYNAVTAKLSKDIDAATQGA